MKKSVMLAAAMITGTIIFAQHEDGRHKRAGGYGETMKTVLSLDDNQDEAIREINKKYATRHVELRKDSTQTREEKRAESQSLMKERKDEIKAVLTPEQNAKWEEHKTQRLEKRKEHRKKGVDKHRERVKTDLSLSDEQAAKMQEAGKAFREKSRELKKDGKGEKEEFKKLKTEYDTTVKSILTDEQYQKWREMKNEKRKKQNRKRK
ncbi:MAG: hypothetical protein KF845_01995 [Cyclobacteriaceae bacterium]|nr:hypothetical protein [Cyclobacteriaceae bacterium]